MSTSETTPTTHGPGSGEPLTGHVVAGTDGSEAGLRGVRLAARTAAARDVPLEVVHASPGYLPVGPLPMVPDGALQSYGRQILARARAAALEEVPGLTVRTTLVSGGRVDALVTAGHRAALLVLGTHPRGLAERIWTGATVTGVAARATCPLWVVPEDAELGHDVDRIVVAVKSLDHVRDLLAPALAEAAATGADVRLVHTWRMVGGYDDVITARVEPDEISTGLRERVLEQTADLRAGHPDVAVEVHVEHGQAARVLARESTHADRLLISRPRHGGAVHHLGATARALLRTAHCLVEVLPPVPVPRQGGERDRSLEMSSGPAATA